MNQLAIRFATLAALCGAVQTFGSGADDLPGTETDNLARRRNDAQEALRHSGSARQQAADTYLSKWTHQSLVAFIYANEAAAHDYYALLYNDDRPTSTDLVGKARWLNYAALVSAQQAYWETGDDRARQAAVSAYNAMLYNLDHLAWSQLEVRVEGIVTAVNAAAGSVTIAAANGPRVLTAVAGTKIERNDLHVALSAFKVGDRGEARISPAGVVTKIEATGP